MTFCLIRIPKLNQSDQLNPFLFHTFADLTRMHSSRMRTVRCSSHRGVSVREGLPGGGGGVCPGDVCPGGVSAQGGCLPGGVSAKGGCVAGGCLP